MLIVLQLYDDAFVISWFCLRRHL